MKTMLSALMTLPHALLCMILLGGITQAAPIPPNGIGIAHPMGSTKTPVVLLETAKYHQTLLNRRSGSIPGPVTIENFPEVTNDPSTDTVVNQIRHNPMDFLRSLVKKFRSSFEWVKTKEGWKWLERQGSKFSELWNRARNWFTRVFLGRIPDGKLLTVANESPLQMETPLVLLEPRPIDDVEMVDMVPKVDAKIEEGNSRNGRNSGNKPSWEHKGKWNDVEGDEAPAYLALDPNVQQMVTNALPGASEAGSAGYIDRWNAAVFQSLGAKGPSVDTGSDTQDATVALPATGLGPDSEIQPKLDVVEPASRPNTVAAAEPKTATEPKTAAEPKSVAAQPKSSPDEPKPTAQEPKIITEPKQITETQVVATTVDSQSDLVMDMASEPRPKVAMGTTLPLPQPVAENQPLSDDKPVPESSGSGGKGNKVVDGTAPTESALPPRPFRPRRRPGSVTPQEKNRGLDDWPGKHPCVVCKDGDPGPDKDVFSPEPFIPRTPRDQQTWWEFLTTFGQGYKFIGPLPYDPKEHYYDAYKITVPNHWKNPKTWVPTPRKPGEPIPEYEDYNPYDPKPLHPSKVQTWQQIQAQAKEELRTGKYKHPRPAEFVDAERNRHGLKDWNGNLVKLPIRGEWELLPPKDLIGLTKLVDFGQYRLACQQLSDEQHIMAGLRPPERTPVDLLIRSLCT